MAAVRCRRTRLPGLLRHHTAAAEPLDAAMLDKIDVATEGMAFSGWF